MTLNNVGVSITERVAVLAAQDLEALTSSRPYKSRPVEVLVMICYTNLVRLCLVTLYNSKAGNNQDVTRPTSERRIAFVLFS